MNKVMLVVVMVLGFSFLAIGQNKTPKNQLHGEVEFETEVRNGEVTPQVKTYLTYGGKSKVGGYCWIQNSKSYNQAYCGAKVAPKSWLEVGAAAGVQTGAKRLQLAGFVWTGTPVKGKMLSNLLVLERGWYRNVSSLQINKQLKASLVKQRFQGTGGRLDFTIGRGISVGGEVLFGKGVISKLSMRYSF